MESICGTPLFQFTDSVAPTKAKQYPSIPDAEKIAHRKGGFYYKGLDLGLDPTGAPKTSQPQWVVDEVSNCIGKIMTKEDWEDTLAVHEAFQYALKTTGLTGQAFENSSEAKGIFYERYADNRAGKNDLSDCTLFRGVRMDRYV